MKLKELGSLVRAREQSYPLPPDPYVVARLDGRGFTKLIHEDLGVLDAFEPAFHVRMVHVVRHLMKDSGFSPVYGYTQSDEVSLLFRPRDDTFGRKGSKWVSVLAGEASACMSLFLGKAVVFDCRLSLLMGEEEVVTYFRWRQSDAERNALNSLCFWGLVKDGKSREEAHQTLKGMGVDAKRALRDANGYEVDGFEDAFYRGVGCHFRSYLKKYLDRRDGAENFVTRRELVANQRLPHGEQYGRYVRELLDIINEEEP